MKKSTYGGTAEAERLREIHVGEESFDVAVTPEQGTAADAGATPASSTKLRKHECTEDCYDC